MIKSFKNYLLIKESSQYSKMIDFTLVKLEYKKEEIINTCLEAIETKPYCICILPKYIDLVKNLVDGKGIKIATVIDFPEGNGTYTEKIRQTKQAIDKGVDELEMVIDYNKIQKLENLPEEQYDKLYETIKKPVKEFGNLCIKNNITSKIIIETGILTLDQIKIALNILIDCDIDYVMTSTGFAETGAEEKKVKFINDIIPHNSKLKIKVSGGIRESNDIKKFYSKGARRFGTSAIIG